MKTRQTRFLLTSTFTKSDLTYKYWKSLEYSKSPDEFLIPFWFSQLSIRKCKSIHSKTWKYFIFSLICLTEWYLVCSIVSAQLYWHPMIQNIDIPPPEDNQHQQHFWITCQSNSLYSEWIPPILAMGPICWYHHLTTLTSVVVWGHFSVYSLWLQAHKYLVFVSPFERPCHRCKIILIIWKIYYLRLFLRLVITTKVVSHDTRPFLFNNQYRIFNISLSYFF